MSDLSVYLVLSLFACVPSLLVRKKLMRHIQDLEQELLNISSAVSQMAELQVNAHRKLSVSQEGLEERMMELSIPSHDTGLPVDRRHQVLTLARQGMALEDIVKRLKAPIGEAELILNLGKFSGSGKFNAAKNEERKGHYA
jgi:hypothetical protein